MGNNIRIVLAGCGGMARAWAEYAAMRPDAEIVGLVDINEASASKFAETHGLRVPIFGDVGEAARKTGANLVFDVTIPEAHKRIALAAFEAGCDVMGEKPMAASLEDADEMREAAKAKGRFYAVMQNQRYTPNIRAFRSIVADRLVGRTGMLSADFFVGPHFGGFREAMDNPLLLDMAIHTFDQARFISGANAISVYCQAFNPAGSWFGGNAAAVCLFEMSDGSVFSYRGSWCSEGAPTSWHSDWRLSGSSGTAIWDGTNVPYYEKASPATEPVFENKFDRFEPQVPKMKNDYHFGCLDDMFDAYLGGRKAETDCEDNIHSMKMVFGALRSAAEGRKVDLS